MSKDKDYEFQFTDMEDISSSSNIEAFSKPDDSSEEYEEAALDLNSFSSATTKAVSDKKKKKKKGKRRFLKVLLTSFLVLVITGTLVCSAFGIWVFSLNDEVVEEMSKYNLNDLAISNYDFSNTSGALNMTSTIYVDNGDGVYTEYKRLHGVEDRVWVDYSEELAKSGDAEYKGIPQNLANAFIAIEDKRFATHSGTDWVRTISAFINMIFPSGSNYGGSSITQQLVKNLTGYDDRTIKRKVTEILGAKYIEENYTKEVILECYLNKIPLGHGKYGVEAAANYYFNKSVNELTLLECASLASITQSPTYNAPDTYPDNNKKRRNTVLWQMYDQGFITKEEYDTAINEELVLSVNSGNVSKEAINSYFVDALIEQVQNDLIEEYGYNKTYASELLYIGGFKIYATIDPQIQSAMESVYTNSATYALTAKNGAKMQGAMTIVDYNGNVKGIVGGIGEKVENRGFNRATSAVRQPGSTIKPLSAYAPAIEKNLITYSTMLNDTATNYNGWKPVNWYGSYWGNITVKYALERSVNTIPVYLVNKMKPQVPYDFLTQKVGITTLEKEDVDLSPMGMGGTRGGFTTIESAAAFAVFGNGGYYYEPKLYTKVLNQSDEVVLDRPGKGSRAISSDTATVMNKLLQNVVYGANGTGKDAASSIPQMKFYAKTGTTNDQKDLWFVGGSPYYVGSCWCGYDIQQDISSSSIALKMWTAVMSKVHKDLPAKEFEYSKYVVDRYYCTQTGGLATTACPGKDIGWYKQNNLPGVCTAHSGEKLGTPAEIAEAEKKAKEEAEKNQENQNNTVSNDNTASTQSETTQE